MSKQQMKTQNLKSYPFTEFIGKTRQQLLEHLLENYKERLPTSDAMEYLLNNPKEVPEYMKDRNWYYFFGSFLRDQDGIANVPCVGWDGGELNRSAYWLGNEWYGFDRVVLLDLPVVLESDALTFEFLSLCPANSKNYEVFGLTKDGKCYGRRMDTWVLLI